ncbi:hypothetical protein [Pedobacter sp.]|uniref:hypothetical protein n=1 Tax=Pedobacter sp. TaxID=1411316 RepID=UPI003BAA3F02
MKNYILAALITFICGNLQAQSKFGILTFTPPSNWSVGKQKDAIVLESNNKESVCRISIFASEPVVINSEIQFLKILRSKTGSTANFDNNPTSVKRSVLNNNICFGIKGSNGNATVYFYSYTNSNQTFFIQLNTNNKECLLEFNNFWKSFLIESGEEENSQPTLTRRKKASAAAPAAPAPAM